MNDQLKHQYQIFKDGKSQYYICSSEDTQKLKSMLTETTPLQPKSSRGVLEPVSVKDMINVINTKNTINGVFGFKPDPGLRFICICELDPRTGFIWTGAEYIRDVTQKELSDALWPYSSSKLEQICNPVIPEYVIMRDCNNSFYIVASENMSLLNIHLRSVLHSEPNLNSISPDTLLSIPGWSTLELGICTIKGNTPLAGTFTFITMNNLETSTEKFPGVTKFSPLLPDAIIYSLSPSIKHEIIAKYIKNHHQQTAERTAEVPSVTPYAISTKAKTAYVDLVEKLSKSGLALSPAQEIKLLNDMVEELEHNQTMLLEQLNK